MGEIADWITSGDMRSDSEVLRDDVTSNWQEGFHLTRDDEEIRLEDMTESHLRNTINFFKEHHPDINTSPLEEELEGRYGHGISEEVQY